MFEYVLMSYVDKGWKASDFISSSNWSGLSAILVSYSFINASLAYVTKPSFNFFIWQLYIISTMKVREFL